MVCYAAITGNTNVDVLIQQKSNGDLVQLPMMAGTLEHDSLNEKYVCYWFKSVYSSNIKNTIQICWEFGLLLSKFKSCDCYKTLHMTWQLCCHVMCKDLYWLNGYEWNNDNIKFPFNLKCE